MSIRAYDIAHARAGDKGNTSNISVILYDERHWDFVARELTEARVLAAFRHIAKGPVALFRPQPEGVQLRDRERVRRRRYHLARPGHPRQEPRQLDAGDRVAGSGLTQDALCM